MDLLDSILSTMDKPPSASEREKKMSRELKAKMEKQQASEKKKREQFRAKVVKQIGDFVNNAQQKKLIFDPMEKINRSIVHEVAETAGLLAYSFGEEEVDRHITVFKKEYPPSEEELQALRRGEEYDPLSTGRSTAGGVSEDVGRSVTKEDFKGHSSRYQEKYKHLIGSECAVQSAVKMEPKKQFGYVPSANKRDLRSIEETLKDIRSKKKAKLDHDATELTDEEQRTSY